MESAEKEQVAFPKTITPADAKGLVERWLLQVRENSLHSFYKLLYFREGEAEICWISVTAVTVGGRGGTGECAPPWLRY